MELQKLFAATSPVLDIAKRGRLIHSGMTLSRLESIIRMHPDARVSAKTTPQPVVIPAAPATDPGVIRFRGGYNSGNGNGGDRDDHGASGRILGQ